MTYETIAVRLPGVGSKRVCVSCTARFYDLTRTPPVCPKCGAEQPPEAPRAAPVRRSPTRHRMMKPAAPVARDADDDAAPVLDPDEDEVEADDDAEAVEDDDDVDVEAVLDDPPEH
jgi:uncharacterized protein (TIGR02300 family)